MSEQRYKLHLTKEQLEILDTVFDSYDWLCDCSDFPNCKDFKIFQKLKKRINNLEIKIFEGRIAGRKAHRKLKSKYIQEGANIQRGL